MPQRLEARFVKFVVVFRYHQTICLLFFAWYSNGEESNLISSTSSTSGIITVSGYYHLISFRTSCTTLTFSFAGISSIRSPLLRILSIFSICSGVSLYLLIVYTFYAYLSRVFICFLADIVRLFALSALDDLQ